MVKSDCRKDNWYLNITNDVYSLSLSLVAFLRIQNYKNPLFFFNLIISSLLWALYNSSMNRGESFS